MGRKRNHVPGREPVVIRIPAELVKWIFGATLLATMLLILWLTRSGF